MCIQYIHGHITMLYACLFCAVVRVSLVLVVQLAHEGILEQL